jgi:hypothetical protein
MTGDRTRDKREMKRSVFIEARSAGKNNRKEN